MTFFLKDCETFRSVPNSGLIRQLQYCAGTEGLPLAEIDDIFESKKPEHVHLGSNTAIGGLNMDQGLKEGNSCVGVRFQSRNELNVSGARRSLVVACTTGIRYIR